MAIDTERPRSRRAILAASLGGAAATVAAALGRPSAARAANGQGVIVGQENHGTVETGVINDDGGETAFYGHVAGNGIGLLGESSGGPGVKGTSVNGLGVQGASTNHIGVWATGVTNGVFASGTNNGVEGSSNSGTGVWGHTSSSTGVKGDSSSSYGVHGSSNSGIGVYGESTLNTGVRGYSYNGIALDGYAPLGLAVRGVSGSLLMPAIAGDSTDGTGVYGFSGAGTRPAPPTKTGIYGEATQDSSSRGVSGKSTAGRGVYGEATTGFGVRGAATSGSAVYGAATTGYGLRSSGRIRFDKSGGIATIAAGTNSIVVTPGIDLTTATAVVATLLGSAGGTTTVHRVAVDTTANTLRIYLTANATVAVKVSWLAFG